MNDPDRTPESVSRSLTRAVYDYLAATGTPVLARLPYLPRVAARTPLPLPVTYRPVSRAARMFATDAAGIDSAWRSDAEDDPGLAVTTQAPTRGSAARLAQLAFAASLSFEPALTFAA